MANKISLEKAKLILSDAEGDKRFWINNGPIVKNYYELQKAIAEMNEDTFSYHANEEKNDFSSWVKDIFGDETLAKKLLKAKSKGEAAESIRDWIEELQNIGERRISKKKAALKKSMVKKSSFKTARKKGHKKAQGKSKSIRHEHKKLTEKKREILEKKGLLEKKLEMHEEIERHAPAKEMPLAKSRITISNIAAAAAKYRPPMKDIAIAVAALFAVVGVINLSKPAITGAAIAELEGRGIVQLWILIIIELIVLAAFLTKKGKQEKSTKAD